MEGFLFTAFEPTFRRIIPPSSGFKRSMNPEEGGKILGNAGSNAAKRKPIEKHLFIYSWTSFHQILSLINIMKLIGFEYFSFYKPSYYYNGKTKIQAKVGKEIL